MAVSLQTRLLLAVGAVALSAVAAVAVSARLGTRFEFNKFQDIERTQELRVRSAVGGLVAALTGRCCDRASIEAATSSLNAGDAAFVFADDGTLVAAFGRGVDLAGVTATYADETLTIRSEERGEGVSAGMSIILRGTPRGQILMADGRRATVHAVPMGGDGAAQPANQFLGSIDRRLIGVTLTVGALALVVTWAVARRIGRPIAELHRATRDLARGDFSRRVEAHGADELGELARAFNQMAVELERQQTLRRNLVHDVAHELRTPLTSLRCRLETVIDGLATDPRPAVVQANEEVAHLSQLVADLEELARAEAGELALSIVDVKTADVVRSSIRVAGLENDPRMRLALDEAAAARGDAMRIRQIVVNLLTNADRHTPANGVITVRTGSRDGRSFIEVHNTGSALADEEAGHVFDRFYRADPSRQRATGGSGLGLAIVKHLTEVQQGAARVSSGPSGVTFSVDLPLGDPNA